VALGQAGEQVEQDLVLLAQFVGGMALMYLFTLSALAATNGCAARYSTFWLMPWKNMFMALLTWRISRLLLSRKSSRASPRRLTTTRVATRTMGKPAMTANAQVSFCLMFIDAPGLFFSTHEAGTQGIGSIRVS
jgi:hypothetical protein